MNTIPYDASRKSLFSPGTATDFFAYGTPHNDAALCAEMARLVYVKDLAKLTTYLTRMNFELVFSFGFDDTDTQAFITQDKTNKTVIVAYRGTEADDPSDIVTDARFLLAAWTPNGIPSGHVHKGWAAAHQASYAAIQQHLPTDAARLLFTGHSLGAALATLAISEYASAPNATTCHLYTFGSPLVGDAEFARSIQAIEHARYVDCCDVVATIPPPMLGYAHSGTLRYIDSHGQVIKNPSTKLINDDKLDARTTFFLRYGCLKGNIFARELADHAPINYLSGIMGLRP